MQESDALHAFSLLAFGFGAAVRRTHWFLPVGLVPVGLCSAIITTGTGPAARTF
jgi:hypothetical protein